jgi:hypothetical protein
MAEEPKLDATFFAFRKRDQRFVLTRAAVGYFVLYALMCGIYLALTWNSLSAIIGWYGSAMQSAMQGGEPAAMPAEVLSVLPYAGLIGLVALVLFAAFEAACLRWLVRGESGGGLLGLTAGADTWRVFATYFVWLALFIVFCIVIGLFYVMTGFIANIGGPARIVAMLLGALAPIAFLALLIWGAVTFAPAAATSIARRRFAFFEAPRVTRARFWELLGSFVILWIGYFVIVLTIGQIIQLPAQNVMAPVMREMMTGGVSNIGPQIIEAMSSPVYLASMGAYLIFSTIVSTVLYIAMFGVNARAVLAADETQPGAPT